MSLANNYRAQQMSNLIRNQWPLLVIVLLTMIAYSSSLYGDFILDDIRFIQRIAEFESIGDWVDSDRPVLLITFCLNYAVHGLDLVGFHVVNLSIHIVGAVTFYLLIRDTAALCGQERRSARAIAFSTSLLWALHPLQTQSVTYIVQRGESLMAMLMLLSLYFTLRAARHKQPTYWQLLVVICCCLGMFSKSVMVVAPLLILLFDRIYLAESWFQLLRRRGVMHAGVLGSAISLVMYFAGMSERLMEHGVGASDTTSSVVSYLLSQSAVLVHYLKLSIWPNPLCLDYGWPICESWKDVVLPGLTIISLLTGVVFLLITKPRVGFIGISFFIVLAPTSSFVPIRDLAFEHRMYLPLASIMLLVVMAVSCVLNRFVADRKTAMNGLIAICVSVAVIAGVATYRRNNDYHDPLVIWGGVTEVAPWNKRGIHNYATLLIHHEDYVAALRVLEKAKYAVTNGNLDSHIHQKKGVAYRHLAKFELAEAELKNSLELEPTFELAHYDLGMTYLDQQRYDDAIAKFVDALRHDPTHHDSRNEIAKIYEQQKNLLAAEHVFISATEIHVKDSLSFERLANYYARHGEYAKAATQYDRALELSPELVDNHLKGAICYERSGDSSAAVRLLRNAVTLFPRHEGILSQLARIENDRTPKLSAK